MPTQQLPNIGLCVNKASTNATAMPISHTGPIRSAVL